MLHMQIFAKEQPDSRPYKVKAECGNTGAWQVGNWFPYFSQARIQDGSFSWLANRKARFANVLKTQNRNTSAIGLCLLGDRALLSTELLAGCRDQCFFSPLNLKKMPANIIKKVSVNILHVPVNINKKMCPWTSEVPVNNLKKKCPWPASNCPWTCTSCQRDCGWQLCHLKGTLWY